MVNLRKTLPKTVLGSIVACFMAVFVMVESNSAEAASKVDFENIKNDIITAYKNYQREVDLSKYNIYDNIDDTSLKEVMTEIINETPYLFYTGQEYSKKIVSGSTLIKNVVLSYSKTYIKADGSINIAKIKKTRKKIDSAVNKALKNINSGMDDIEKAMVLHDYIAINTSYSDQPSDSSRLNETGVFINHKANCQGYSVAYGLLLNKAGIDVQYVSSSAMGHMWNLVKINNAWYNVDVTWDDPVDTYSGNDQYGFTMHKYFLGSTSSFRTKGYYGFNARQASDRRYVNMYWKDVTCSFAYSGGKWLYMSDKGILERESLSYGTAKLLYKVNGMSFVRFNVNKYYFISDNSIYIYNRKPDNVRLVWTVQGNYNSSYYITQIMYSNGKVCYRVLKDRRYKTGSFKVKKSGMAA